MESSNVDPAAYIIDSNEAVQFKIVRYVKDIENEETSFPPEMSHQIFGEMEKIFGYKGLVMKLYYSPAWLKTYLSVEYEEKLENYEGIEIPDTKAILAKFLGHDFYENIDTFVDSLKSENTFAPFGQLVYKFAVQDVSSGKERNFVVYHVSGSNVSKPFLQYYTRLQPFLLWYIDAANFIDTDDEKWQYFIMYENYSDENGDGVYGVVGFGTAYENYAYPMNIRPRISQLLILPPYRKMGLAAYFVHAVYFHYRTNAQVLDVTVEDPTDEFQYVRDFVHLCQCRDSGFLSVEKLKGGFTPELAQNLQKKFKIPKKEARRLYEISLLSDVNVNDEKEYKDYRLMVKKRLNAPFQKIELVARKMTSTFKPDEVNTSIALNTGQARIDKLKSSYKQLEDQYNRVLQRFNTRPLNL